MNGLLRKAKYDKPLYDESRKPTILSKKNRKNN